MERKLQQNAVSRDGYIISQYRTENVPYGRRTSNINGCGWIAAYNFFLCMGRPKSVEELTDALSRHSLFRGRLGTSPFRLRRYLKKQGYDLDVTLSVKKAADKAASARAGILLYRHSNGWHFVTFTKSDAPGRLRFFNASQGEGNHIPDMEAFLKKDNLSPVIYLLTLSDNAYAPHINTESL